MQLRLLPASRRQPQAALLPPTKEDRTLRTQGLPHTLQAVEPLQPVRQGGAGFLPRASAAAMCAMVSAPLHSAKVKRHKAAGEPEPHQPCMYYQAGTF